MFGRMIWRSVALFSMLAPAVASAQGRGGGGGGMGMGGPTPIGVDLGKVPVGAWAEYTMTRGEMPSRKVRFSVVGRDKAGTKLEQSSEGGPNGGGPTVLGLTLDDDPTKEGGVKKVVMQRGDADPMEMPAGGLGGGPGGGPGGGAMGSGACPSAGIIGPPGPIGGGGMGGAGGGALSAAWRFCSSYADRTYSNKSSCRSSPMSLTRAR